MLDSVYVLQASTSGIHCCRKPCLRKDYEREWKSAIIIHRGCNSLFQGCDNDNQASCCSVWSGGEAGQAGRIISFPCLSVIESVALQAGFVLFWAVRNQPLYEAGYPIIWTNGLIQHGKCYDPKRNKISLCRKSSVWKTLKFRCF